MQGVPQVRYQIGLGAGIDEVEGRRRRTVTAQRCGYGILTAEHDRATPSPRLDQSLSPQHPPRGDDRARAGAELDGEVADGRQPGARAQLAARDERCDARMHVVGALTSDPLGEPAGSHGDRHPEVLLNIWPNIFPGFSAGSL